MDDGITDIAGIEIPSTNPVFPTVASVHLLLGLACVATAAIAIVIRALLRHPLMRQPAPP